MHLGRHYRLSGRVQRVCFRAFTQAMAMREGIQGWVRNTPDGGVEVSAEGEAEALHRFEQRLRQGPPSARVEQVEITDIGAGGRTAGFEVRE